MSVNICSFLSRILTIETSLKQENRQDHLVEIVELNGKTGCLVINTLLQRISKE